jgi:hypothetical protein
VTVVTWNYKPTAYRAQEKEVQEDTGKGIFEIITSIILPDPGREGRSRRYSHQWRNI